jgi:hypothetical protein
VVKRLRKMKVVNKRMTEALVFPLLSKHLKELLLELQSPVPAYCSEQSWIPSDAG